MTKGHGSLDAPGPPDGWRGRVSVRWLAILGVSLAVAAAIPLDLLPWLRGPAPYPPEWEWGYRPGGPAHPLSVAAMLAGLVIALLAATGGGWARRRPRVAAVSVLAVATAAGWCLQLAALEREPAGPLRALVARALSTSISSYHAVAIEEGGDPRALLRSHATRLPELLATAKHAATHPPGPVLFYRAAVALCERSPALTDVLLRAAGAARRDSQTEQKRAERAGGLLGALVLGLLGVLTLWPLALLSEALGLEPLPAARVGLLWTLVPGLVVMARPSTRRRRSPSRRARSCWRGRVGPRPAGAWRPPRPWPVRAARWRSSPPTGRPLSSRRAIQFAQEATRGWG